MLSRSVPAWTAGLSLTWAPLMLGARAQVAAFKATEGARRTQLEQASLDLYAELRDDLRTLELGARQVRADEIEEGARRAERVRICAVIAGARQAREEERRAGEAGAV